MVYNGKPYKNGWFGGKTPPFQETPIWKYRDYKGQSWDTFWHQSSGCPNKKMNLWPEVSLKQNQLDSGYTLLVGLMIHRNSNSVSLGSFIIPQILVDPGFFHSPHSSVYPWIPSHPKFYGSHLLQKLETSNDATGWHGIGWHNLPSVCVSTEHLL